MENIETILKTINKNGDLPKGEYQSINANTEGHNEGAPCGACGAC